MSEELDRNAILSQDNPDGDVFADVAPETVTQPAEETQPEQQAQEQQQEQTPVTASDSNPYPDGSPQHNAFKQQREDLMARLEAEKEAAVLRAIQERDAQWQQATKQPAQQETAPWPDPIIEPEAYAARVQQEIYDKVEAAKRELKEEQARKDAASQAANYERETQRLMKEANVPVETLRAAHAFLSSAKPHLIDACNKADNPFVELLDVAKRYGFNAPNAAPVQPSTSDAIPDHIRQQVLAEEARKRAAAGASPQTTMPRGVGSVPSGAGFSDALPPPSEYHKLSAAEYAAVKAKVLNQ